jgi:hypothetical protein
MGELLCCRVEVRGRLFSSSWWRYFDYSRRYSIGYCVLLDGTPIGWPPDLAPIELAAKRMGLDDPGTMDVLPHRSLVAAGSHRIEVAVPHERRLQTVLEKEFTLTDGQTACIRVIPGLRSTPYPRVGRVRIRVRPTGQSKSR